MFNFNISSFFGNSGSNNNNSIFGSFDFTQYASIRNGSYGKLTKAYYAKDAEESKSNKTDKKTTDKKDVSAVTPGLSKVKSEADGLKSAADKLAKDDMWKQTAGEVDMNKVADAVKGFVNEYNDVITQSSKVNSKDVSQNVRTMTNLTNTMSKSLSKIGVTVSSDGKMSVDETALKSADAKSVKAMFSGTYSYGAQVASSANEIAKAAVMGASTYSGDGTLTNTMSGLFNNWI